MKLVDTNVAAHLLMSGLATAARARNTTHAKAMIALDQAHQLFDGALHAVDDQTALAAAIKFQISGYDARFLAAAIALGARLVTEDAKLRAKAPELTWSIAEALSSPSER